jgi:signal transduction histidine kinase
LRRIQAAANTLIYLLEDVLTLEEMGSDQLEFSPRPMDLASFCEEQLEAWRFSTNQDYNLIFSLQGDCSAVHLDEKLIWHVLNNLLSNAIKYSAKESTITLKLLCYDEAVTLQVMDEGIGIPSESLPNLFQPFYRAQNVGYVTGTGLGLAIAQRCVALHGGAIAVESVIGQGTTVTVTIPRTLPPSPS